MQASTAGTTQAPAGAASTEAVAARRPRLRSIDAFRGAVLAFMVLTPATGDPATYPFLRHAAWDGPTASDLILPTFLVTSGVSLAFLLRPPVGRAKRLRLLRRLVLLVLLGLVYNAYGTSGSDLSALRLTGVLQMIGISGFLAAVVVLGARRGEQDRPAVVAAVVVALTALHGIGLARLAGRCGEVGACSPYAGWDRGLLGVEHTYGAGAPGYDPEGIAPTVAATALVLIGWLAGRHLASASRAGLLRAAGVTAGAGLGLLGGAWVLDSVDAANKRLLTPAFVALAAGVALVAMAGFVVLLDVGRAAGDRPRLRAVTFPLVSLGRNALVVYLVERFLLQTAATVRAGDRSIRAAVLDALPGGETSAHLAYTGALAVLITAVTAVLHWRRRYLAL